VKEVENDLLSVSNTALFCLSDMDSLKTMLESNVSEGLMRERIGRYTYCALVLSGASEALYKATGDEMYWNVHVAAENLSVFFNHARNSENPKRLSP